MVSQTLDDLIIKSGVVLKLSDDELRTRLISMAEENTPNKTYELALALASKNFDVTTAISFAKATRFLSIIKRDFGQEKFKETIQ